MGILMDFYAGNASQIGSAFTSGDLDQLTDLAKAHADFSLHLSPTDLDILSEEALAMAGCEPIGLLESLEENVGGDRAESSADTVSRLWVAAFASFPEERVNELAERWLCGVAEDHGEAEAEVTTDAREAIRQLIVVCRTAEREALDVVHTWSL